MTAFYAERFMHLTNTTTAMTEIDLKIVAQILDHVVVKKDGTLVFFLLDGSQYAVQPE